MTSSRPASLGPAFISVALTSFISLQQHNGPHLLCSNGFSDGSHGSRTILSATMGTSFHSATYMFWYCPPPALPVVRMLCLPTISALRCTQEEECCSAMRHMHIAPCGLLHSQITHLVLGAETSTHTVKQLFLSPPTRCTLFFFTNPIKVAARITFASVVIVEMSTFSNKN